MYVQSVSKLKRSQIQTAGMLCYEKLCGWGAKMTHAQSTEKLLFGAMFALGKAPKFCVFNFCFNEGK